MSTHSIQFELQEFVRFASSRVEQGENFASVEELVQHWRQNSDFAEAISDLRQGIEDAAACKDQSVSDAFSQIRNKLGISD